MQPYFFLLAFCGLCTYIEAEDIMIGTLIKDFSSKQEALEEIGESNIDEVKGIELSQSEKQLVNPGRALVQGSLITVFNNEADNYKINEAIGKNRSFPIRRVTYYNEVFI